MTVGKTAVAQVTTTTSGTILVMDGRDFGEDGRKVLPHLRKLKARLGKHPDVIEVVKVYARPLDRCEMGDHPYPTVLDRFGIVLDDEGEGRKPEPEATTEATVGTGLGGAIASVIETELGKIAKGPDIAEIAKRVEALIWSKIPRKTEHTWPDGTTITCDGIEHPAFERLAKLLNGGAKRVWISGDAGTGKTYVVRQIAKAMGIHCYIQPPVADKYELLGYKDANGTYQPTELYRWATHDGPCMLLMDEIDGCLPNALLAINASLANGVAVFPDGQVEIDPRKIVVATANTTGEGPTLKYNARLAQDRALLSRFLHKLHWGLHEPTESLIARSTYPVDEAPVLASQTVRRNLAAAGIEMEWGPRNTYAVCEGIVAGLTLMESLMSAGLSTLDDDQVKRATKEMSL